MNVSDIAYILQWWLFLLGIGLIFLPVTTKIFPLFFDKGYSLAKIFGTAVIAYLVFILGLSHILPLSRLTVLLVLFALLGLYFLKSFIHPKKTTESTNTFIETIKRAWPIFFFEELLFLAGLFFWAHIRSFSPDIHGLEKFMDYGFINSMLRAEYFPPKDMWLTPYAINYYYFGHLTAAVLTKLTNIPSNISYNLMLATVFSFCLTASFSIAATLASRLFSLPPRRNNLKIIISGLLTAFLVTLSGNLHTIYTLFKPYENEHPVPPWQLAFSPFTFPNGYWYPNATRFIYNTIHEFPIYSWVVADLHGHVFDIPYVLLTIAVLLSLFLKFQAPNNKSQINTNERNSKRFLIFKFDFWSLFGNWHLASPRGSARGEFGHLLLVSFLLAVMYMTNAWDGFIYFLLTGLVLFSVALLHRNTEKSFSGLLQALLGIIPAMLVVGVAFILFSLPFSFNFKPFVSGIGVLCAPKFLTSMEKIGPLLFEANHCQKSPLWQLLILYGFFYFFIASFMLFILRTTKLHRSDLFVLILIVLGTFLIVIPEFLYVKDIYPAHYRANTMFKLVFQSFIMLSIASGYIIIRLISNITYQSANWRTKIFNISSVFLLFTFLFLLLVFIYPRLAISSYYGDLKTYYGLDGTKYLKTLYPEDYAAINWLNQNIQGQPVILEAQGDSYTDHARISSNTGLPTVLGWTVHEWLWRGKYDGGVDAPAPRIGEIQKMYESDNLSETKKLLDKYGVEYVYIGGLERQKYPNINEEKFNQLGKVIYQTGDTKIYLLN